MRTHKNTTSIREEAGFAAKVTMALIPLGAEGSAQQGCCAQGSRSALEAVGNPLPKFSSSFLRCLPAILTGLALSWLPTFLKFLPALLQKGAGSLMGGREGCPVSA